MRDVSAIVWAYCRTDRCIQTSARIDLRVVKLTGGLRTTSSPPVLPEISGRRAPNGPIFGIPSDMSTDGMCRPSADRNKGNMTLTVWTGWTTASAALQAAAAVAGFFFS